MNDSQPLGYWPVLLSALVIFFLILTGWSVRQAATSGSEVTNPLYYSHGLKYNQTLVEKEASAALGWRLVTEVEARRLLFHLKDRDGQPVGGAGGKVTYFGPDKQKDSPLTEISSGTYAAEIPPDFSSQISARIELRRDSASLSRALLVNLATNR